MDFCISILGGGIIGVTTAYLLSRYKVDVALFEKEVEVGFGATKANCGIVHSGLQENEGSLRHILCLKGRKALLSFCSKFSVPFKESGALMIGKEEELYSFFLKGKRCNLTVSLLSKQEIREKEPLLNAEVALYIKDVAIISPSLLCFTLFENAKENGVEFFFNEKVLSIKKERGFWALFTEKRCVRTKHIIYCAAEGVELLKNIHPFSLKFRKGEIIVLKNPIVEHVIYPLPSSFTKGILIVPTVWGGTLLGPTSEPVEAPNKNTTKEGYNQIFSFCKKMHEGVDEEDVITFFAGTRCIHGEDFFIERLDEGLVVAVGIQSPGLSAAFSIAALLLNKLKEKFELKKEYKEVKNPFINRSPSSSIVCECNRVDEETIILAIKKGANTLDGIKFRTFAMGGECGGTRCMHKILHLLSNTTRESLTSFTKKGRGSPLFV